MEKLSHWEAMRPGISAESSCLSESEDQRTFPVSRIQPPVGGYEAHLLALNIADDYFKAKSQVDTLEEDMEAKDRETYDMKHDLIAAEIQAGDLKKSWKRKRIELEHVRGEMEELQRQLDKANKDLEDLLKA